MGAKAHRINFMVADDLKKELDLLVPPGERSLVVNEALRKELALLRRKKLTDQLTALRKKTRTVATSEIVDALRSDREGGR